MTPIPQDLIIRALALCDKTMKDMEEIVSCTMEYYEGVAEYDGWQEAVTESEFSIENFFYYLLSPEFIEKYLKKVYQYTKATEQLRLLFLSRKFGEAIYEYQSGNSDPLISLLTKI